MSAFLNFLSGAQRADASGSTSDVTLPAPEPRMDETHITKPQHGVKRNDPFGKIVDIVVGSGDHVETFEIHRSKLRGNSDYFKAAFKREPEIPSFDFPNEEPEVFGRIQNWMYDKEFIFEGEKSGTGQLEVTSTQNTQEDENDMIEPEPLRVAGCLNERGERVSKIAHSKPFPEVFDHRHESDASDDDEATQAPENSQTQIESPTPLDTLTLSKIYTFAEQLEMSKLCNEIIEVLGKRLGYDKVTPSDALLYAFQRSKTGSPLRELLIDFTARTAPINDMLESADLDTDEDSLELLTALVRKLGEVRGNICFTEDEWAEHFQITVHEYLVKSRK